MPVTDVYNSSCSLCDRCFGAPVVCSPGSGDPRAGVVIVGEDPGTSRAADVLLTRALAELAGLHRDRLYVTHVVKCATHDGRPPTSREAKTCAGAYLGAELAQVGARFVLGLGNTALMALLGRSGITKHHGNVFPLGRLSLPDTSCMVTLHPAAVLRNPKYAQAFASDVARFGRLVRDEDSTPKTSVKLIRTAEHLRLLGAALERADVVAFDVETYVDKDGILPPYEVENYQYWRPGRSRLASVSFTLNEGTSYVVLLDHPHATLAQEFVWKTLRRGLTRRDCTYVAHNGKFDCAWLRDVAGVSIRLDFDTMLAAHLLDENGPKGLKPLAQTVLGASAYDVGEELKDPRAMRTSVLAVYNGKDTDYTLRLANRFAARLDDDERLRRLYDRLVMPASRALLDVESYGVWLDLARWQVAHDEALHNKGRLYDYFDRKFVPEFMRPVNLNSPQQVGRVLFEVLGLPVHEHTATGAPSTAEATLIRLAAEGHKAAVALTKYRKWTKYLSTYLLPWRYLHLDDAQRLRSSYLLHGTVTGRLSGKGGIQQVPRDVFIRSILGAPPGWTFVQADYSQIELRVAAMIAREEAMLRLYMTGADIHLARACRMTGKQPEDVTKDERTKAKAVNFGFLYGMGAPKFTRYAFENYGVTVSEDEARAIRQGFFDDYPGLRRWHTRQRRLVNKHHRVVSPLGRIRHLPDIASSDEGIRAECERQAINSVVQSTASDITLFALVQLHARLPFDRARVLGTMHDSIFFEIRDECVDEWLPVIKETMEDRGAVERAFRCPIDVPLVADIERGTHWGEGEEWRP